MYSTNRTELSMGEFVFMMTHDKIYIQDSLWHLEPYSIRKIIEFILIYINGPFDSEEISK